MEQQPAIDYLKNRCIPQNTDDAALIAEWQQARDHLGVPMANAGTPEIEDISAAHDLYVQQMQANWQPLLQTRNWQPKMVGIDELLAFQFEVDQVRPHQFCSDIIQPVDIQKLLEICLPQSLTPAKIDYHSVDEHSILLLSQDINFRSMGPFLGNGVAGLGIGTGLPHIQVLRFNGRCYLVNGFHRMAGLRSITSKVPCLFCEVNSAAELGLGAGQRFDLPLLESNDPPTCGHFCAERAHAVSLRSVSRVIHVTWSSHVVVDDR